MTERDMQKAALRGEPSYVWRAGQRRRLDMIVRAAGDRLGGLVLENGCGVGMYVEKLTGLGSDVIGLEYDLERAAEARIRSDKIINAAGEFIPLPSSTFDLILSHEVIEHVQDDRAAILEMIRLLKPGGRAVPAFACPDFGFAVAGLVDEGLVVLFVFAAHASVTASERAANDVRKSRRFKNFLRQRQPVAETKRPCH